MGPTIGSPELDPSRINDTAERFLYQSHETIRNPLLKWVEAFDAASCLIPELSRLGKEAERLAERVRKAELNFRKRFYAASGGGAAVPAGGSAMGSCTSFFSCKSRSKSIDDLRILRPDLADPGTEEDRDLTAVHRGTPIALELREDEASMHLREEMKKLEVATDAYDAMENSLNESFVGLCLDSQWLKSYMTSQLMFVKDLLQESLSFLGPSLSLSTALGPGSTSTSPLLPTVTSKKDLIAAMPAFLDDLVLRDSILGEGAHAHKIQNQSTPLAKATSIKAKPLHRTSNITPRSSEDDTG